LEEDDGSTRNLKLEDHPFDGIKYFADFGDIGEKEDEDGLNGSLIE
jgi:hypothetical protein